MPVVYPRGMLLVAGAFFVTLAGAVLLFGALPADTAVREGLLARASPAVVAVMHVVNYGGDWRVLLPATLLLFVVFERARVRWWVWIALMVTAPLAEGFFKIMIGRSRPESSAFGFPSGHVTAAAAFGGAVLYLAGSLPPLARRVVRTLALVVVVSVALARVILHAHWPSDTLGGVALGLALASIATLVASAEPPRARPR